MGQKFLLGLSILLLLFAIGMMSHDLFMEPDDAKKKPYEYDLNQLRQVDPALIDYSEIHQITPPAKDLLGVATDSLDRIYVTADDKVLMYDEEGELYSTIHIGAVARCITIGPRGNIYLGVGNHVEVYTVTGHLLERWDCYDVESVITSIAVSGAGVFVADAGKWLVHHYNREGKFKNSIGRKNLDKGIPGFFVPSPYFDLAIGREEELWVVNPGRHSLESYDEAGNPISSWTRTSMHLDGFSGCCNPSHMAILSNGSFVTSEKGLERVKVHLPSGDFKCVVAPPAQFEPGTRGLDIAVDSGDRIIILDPVKGLIRIFQKNG
ncbi:hypothetical protein DMA11_16250 [Marinilabiliaceae bacterium JC017]|nr:hypothetical protein DMA11_16250 [Marinilabiliaceae bacterium JC017]